MHPHVSRMRLRVRVLRPSRPSKSAELWLRSALVALVDELRVEGESIAQHLRPWLHVGDALPPGGRELLSRAAARFGSVTDRARQLSAIAIERNVRGVDEALIKSIRAAISIDVSKVIDRSDLTHAMARATAENVAKISSIPERYFRRLGRELAATWRDGMRWEDLVEVVQKVGGVTEKRARLIARDQTAKMSSAFNKVRQIGLGISRYIWSDSHDKRVRHSHHALNGHTCEWEHPPLIEGEPLNPGEDYNCRCVPIPVIHLDEIEERVRSGDAGVLISFPARRRWRLRYREQEAA